ncbi:MAG: type II toxin-antitoxin system VapC family toxin [Anaerolineales bacterium]
MSAKPPVYVLDSFAVLAYLDSEVGVERVQMILEEASQGHAQVILSIINFGEVLYITEREVGLVQAQAALAAIEQLPIEILPATKEAVLAAAHIKANYPVAYADAFAVVAARESSGTIITGDPEFQAIQELVAVEWLGQKG